MLIGVLAGIFNNINFTCCNCRTVKINEVGLNIIAGVTVVIANAVIGLTVTTATIF